MKNIPSLKGQLEIKSFKNANELTKQIKCSEYIMMIVWFITKWINYSIQKNQLGIL
jgi:hypothetical protein